MTKVTRKSSKPIIQVGCLFSAIGGFAKAFQNVGANICWANEIDAHATKTFRANFPDVTHFHKPIQELSVFRDSLRPVDIITAGFPCQPFSIAGEKLGFSDDRGTLFLHIVRLLNEFGDQKPKVLLMENVKNLKAHDKGRTFKRIQAEIQKAGYWFFDTNAMILNTSTHTSIPQNRERIFMIAANRDHFSVNDIAFPDPFPANSLRPVWDFLDTQKKGLESLYFSETSQYYPLFKVAIEAGGDNAIYQLRRSYVRKNMSQTCFTLMANMGEGGHNQPVIKDRWGIRKLSTRECARLQGYEDEWFIMPDSVSQNQMYKQIGNSVTVPLVTRIAEIIANRLREQDC